VTPHPQIPWSPTTPPDCPDHSQAVNHSCWEPGPHRPMLPGGSFRPWQDGGDRAAVHSDSFSSLDWFLIRSNSSKIENGTRLDSRPGLTKCRAGWVNGSGCQNEDRFLLAWLLAGQTLGCRRFCGRELGHQPVWTSWAGTCCP
jgi:hypothetical protein